MQKGENIQSNYIFTINSIYKPLFFWYNIFVSLFFLEVLYTFTGILKALESSSAYIIFA